jgi:hypothetical protein
LSFNRRPAMTANLPSPMQTTKRSSIILDPNIGQAHAASFGSNHPAQRNFSKAPPDSDRRP